MDIEKYTALSARLRRQTPVAHLKFWARQYYSGHGEGLEVCREGEVGDDREPAFPVFDFNATESADAIDQLIARVRELEKAFQTFIDEHEECTDGDDWMAQMCSMEAVHVAQEFLDESIDAARGGDTK